MATAGQRGVPRILYIGAFATMADRFAVAPLLLPIAASFHASLAAVSGAASLYYLAYGLMPPLYGVLSDHFGRVRVIRAALVGTALADVFSALSPNLTALLVARFVTGGIACGVFPTTLVYLADRFPFKVRQHAITNVLVFVALGTTAGTLGAGLTAHALSWRYFFLIPGAIALAVAIALRGLPESLVTRSSQNPLEQVATVLRHRWAVFVLLLAVVVGAVMFGFVTYLAPALEANGQSSAIAGAVVASYGVSVLFCIGVFGYVARRLPAALILAGGAALLLTGYLLAGATQSVAAILAASVLAGGAYAFMQSTFQTWATDVVPEARGTATSLFATAIFSGAALATSGAAGLASNHDYHTVFLVAALITLPVLVAGSLGRWRYRGSETDALPMPN
ncbi:MAG TPA: MFS transporter [Candidatus Dormibacteraeota bacterium]|nr:MFS transporter [Candidatus Dormibacteraeota bacterium]